MTADRSYAAFFSYARGDDDHDDGQISALRDRLEGETRMLLGGPFDIFQDRTGIEWGRTGSNGSTRVSMVSHCWLQS